MKTSRLCFAGLAACCLLFASQASADVVIASYDFGSVTATNNSPSGIAADFVTSGATSNITDDPSDPLLRRAQTNAGSSDGTFGDGVTSNTTLGTPAGGGRLQFFNGNPNASTGVPGAEDANLFLNVINDDPSQSLTFDELLFDVVVQNSGAPDGTHNAYSVIFENTTTSSVTGVLGSATDLATGTNDANVDLTGSGISLAAGESGRFVVNFFGASTGSNSSGSIDNIAITGQFVPPTSTIPEPSSLALLGLGAISLITRRRR